MHNVFSLCSVSKNVALWHFINSFIILTWLLTLFPCFSFSSLFGISPVVLSNCSHTWMFKVNPELNWHHFVNPIMLLVLYYTLATLVRLWLQEPVDMVSLQTRSRYYGLNLIIQFGNVKLDQTLTQW